MFDDPGMHAAYIELRKADPRMREVEALRATARTLTLARMDGDTLDDLERERLVSLIVRVDGKDKPDDLRRRGSTYLREVAAGACQREAARLFDAAADAAMEQVQARYSRAAQSHASTRAAIADMRSNGAARATAPRNDERDSIIEMIGALRGVKKPQKDN
jgi:hypothetical protein